MKKEIIFKSSCPAFDCDNDKVYYWYHDECPSWSNLYLSDQAKIRCDYCGEKWDFLNSFFNCSERKTKFKKSNLKRALFCIINLTMNNDLPYDFGYKLQRSLINQEKNYK